MGIDNVHFSAAALSSIADAAQTEQRAHLLIEATTEHAIFMLDRQGSVKPLGAVELLDELSKALSEMGQIHRPDTFPRSSVPSA